MVDLATFFGLAVDGIGLGALYALVAMGFSLIYKVTGVLNFAQGQLALVGAYGVVVLSTPALVGLGLPAALGLVGTILFGIFLGVALERVVFRNFIGEPVLSVIIVTLALGGIIEGTVVWLLGPNFRPYPDVLSPDWSVGLPLGASISASFAIGVALSLVVVLALMAFFRYTVMGSVLRAAASDEQAAMVMGVSIERTIIVAWTLSITVTAVGGVLLAMARGGAALSIEAVGILIFAAVVFGGLDSVPGAFIGAIVVGLLEELSSFYLEGFFGPGFGQIAPMIFLLAVIIVKPYGLFGTERIERL
jgi:branched-chain amino acid transport system permease protein